MIKLNGENCEISNITVQNLLAEKCYDEKKVAVEINGEIVPKSKYANHVIKDGDSVEVVCFVGGG